MGDWGYRINVTGLRRPDDPPPSPEDLDYDKEQQQQQLPAPVVPPLWANSPSPTHTPTPHVIVLESSHPHDQQEDSYSVVCIPGASSYVVTFDERTSLDPEFDYIRSVLFPFSSMCCLKSTIFGQCLLIGVAYPNLVFILFSLDSMASSRLYSVMFYHYFQCHHRERSTMTCCPFFMPNLGFIKTAIITNTGGRRNIPARIRRENTKMTAALMRVGTFPVAGVTLPFLCPIRALKCIFTVTAEVTSGAIR